MSEQFYDKVLSLFFGFSLFLVLTIANSELLILYLSAQSNVFYVCWLALLAAAAGSGMRFYQNFYSFRANLGLFIPNNEAQTEPLSIDVDGKALQVCLYYRNGATLEELKQNFGFNHPNQPKRELIKGLDFLLRFYDEHKQEDVKTT
jgi:hypothetical protein